MSGAALGGTPSHADPAAAAPAAPPGTIAPALADEEADPAFAAHVARLRRDGEIEIDEVVIEEQEIVGRLRGLATDRPDELQLEIVGRVSDAWVARLEQYAADAGFARTTVLPDDL
jgi:hypothetical protein